MSIPTAFKAPIRVGLLVLLAVVLGGCDWPNFMFGADRTGFNPFESTIGVNNVSSLHQVWSVDLTPAAGSAGDWSPIVAGGDVFVPFGVDQLGAFDQATGASKWTTQFVEGTAQTVTVNSGVAYVGLASGTFAAVNAATGAGLWTTTDVGASEWSPVVSNGVLYTSSAYTHTLYAFSSSGTTNCSGTPKVCSPLWSAPLGGGNSAGSPSVANGVVYVGSATTSGTGEFDAFDATGVTNCAGSPKICSPLWTATTGAGIGTPATVANGVVYVSSDRFYAFDAKGETNCSGSPTICSPLWSASVSSGILSEYPFDAAVAYGKVYVSDTDGRVNVFDAEGATNCSGTPKTCMPLWTTSGDGESGQSPAVANGVVYIGGSAFDANGVANCSGTPRVCTPLWTGTTVNTFDSPMVIVNGMVYVVNFVTDPLGDSMTLYCFGLSQSS